MKDRPLDFRELLNKVREPGAGGEQLSIWGGRCAEDRLPELVGGWVVRADMPYRIWEYVNKILFEKNTFPVDHFLLERGRLFGPGGDLCVRRDGGEFAWSFTGKGGISPPPGFPGEKFWQDNDKTLFHLYEGKTLLWGERKTCRELWRDDKVARAKLDYPVPREWKRVQLTYRIFCREGRVQFVWLQGLQEWRGNGNG